MKYLKKLNTWHSIPNYEGYYEIHSSGKIRSITRKVNYIHGERTIKGKECKMFLRNGYFAIALSKNGYVKQFSIHRLLSICFIPNPENKETVNHKNGDKLDNNLSNLEWATQSEQISHAIKNGLYTPYNFDTKGKTGVLHNRSKPVIQCTKEGIVVNVYGSACEAARETGSRQTGISKCCRNELQLHNGFKWKFYNH